MNTESISEIFQKAIYEALKDKPIEELKTLDWFTWETDFFLEEKCDKAA